MKNFFNFLSKRPKNDIFIDIDRDNLIQKQLNLKDLKSGKVYRIKNMPEIYKIREIILERISQKYGYKYFEEIKSFFFDPVNVPEDPQTCNNLIKIINEIKNERVVSSIFSNFIDYFDIDSNHTYLDTGYFRFMMPEENYNKLRIFGKNDTTPSFIDNESEVTFQNKDEFNKNKLLTKVHRDINSKHSHFQFNVWFPMHNLNEKDSLEFYPDKYKSDCEYYLNKEYDDINYHSHYGVKYQKKLNFGDCLIFHSQTIHDSPRSQPIPNRLSVELRVATNLNDNNFHYRRLFIKLNNFK